MTVPYVQTLPFWIGGSRFERAISVLPVLLEISRSEMILPWMPDITIRMHFLLMDWCEKVNCYLTSFQTCNIFVDVMAEAYTEETLQPLNRTQLIKLCLKTQEQTNNNKNSDRNVCRIFVQIFVEFFEYF